MNHNGSLEMAMKLIDAAANAGADAVKFQTFKTEKIVSRRAPKAEYQVKTTADNESQFDMLKKLELNDYNHRVLIEYCHKRSIEFLSTPFDLDSVNLLAGTYNLPKLKLPSGEITNALLLLKAAQTGKPIFLSTGMSTLGEIEMALGVLAFGYSGSTRKPSLVAFQEAYFSNKGRQALQENVILLHCTTEYPTPFEDVNLQSMDTLRTAFGLPVGYSDHTAGITIPIAAVARGAVVIEKHFTMDRNLPGPDHKASLEPDELKKMVASIRQVEKALGSSFKIPASPEIKNRAVVRKSLVAAKDISKGEKFNEENLTVKRPGTGISPFYYWDMLGKKADRDYRQDEEVDL